MYGGVNLAVVAMWRCRRVVEGETSARGGGLTADGLTLFLPGQKCNNAYNKQSSDTLVVTLESPCISASQVVSGTKQPSALTDLLITENRRRTEKTW